MDIKENHSYLNKQEQLLSLDDLRSSRWEALSLTEFVDNLNKQGLSVGNIFIIDDVIKLIEINYKIYVIYVYFSSSKYKITYTNKNSTKTLSLIKHPKRKNISNPKETLLSNIVDFIKNINIQNNYLVFNNINTIIIRDGDILVYKNNYISPHDNESIKIYPLIEYDDLKNKLKSTNNWDDIKSFHNLIFSEVKYDNSEKNIQNKYKILKKCVYLLYQIEQKEIKTKEDLIVLHSNRKKVIEQAGDTLFEIDQLNYYHTLYNFFANNKKN